MGGPRVARQRPQAPSPASKRLGSTCSYCWALKRMQYRPALIDGSLAQTGLALEPEPP
jgi:hypothetical protein